MAAGAFLIAYLSPVPYLAAVGQAAGATLAALTGAFLLRRMVGFHTSLSRLRDALVKACNVRGAATAMEGRLVDKPAAALFVELLRQKSDAVLTLTHDGTVRKIHFEKGQVRFAQSNVKGETAGAAQVAAWKAQQALGESRSGAAAIARRMAGRRMAGPGAPGPWD